MKKYLDEKNCPCGKAHTADIDDVTVGSGVIKGLPEIIRGYGAKKPFILADTNTFTAAGKDVCGVLDDAEIKYSSYIFPDKSLKPDERAVGGAVMHFDNTCDIIIAVGSGVINDIGKILSKVSGKKYIIVATAPSMDGYASATSSMDVDGLKVSLPSRSPDTIIGDTDILKNAPIDMLRAGLGDMLAKYVSIAEWRISNIINGEYYCENVADLVRTALKKCVDNAEGLVKREDAAVEAAFEGLILGGLAMSYAGVSRPASGVEHYFSHIWDMRGLEFGTKTELHGIQCAIGTLCAAKIYDEIKKLTPNIERAEKYVNSFDVSAWHRSLKMFVGKGASSMIELEKKEKKYDLAAHSARFDVISSRWSEIVDILNEELPFADEIEKILDSVGLPKSAEYLGVDNETLKMTFFATRDIRDKYVLSRLVWDLGAEIASL